MSSLRRFLSRSLGWLIAGIWFLCRALLIAWATLAIYYSNLPWAEACAWRLAVAFAAFAIWALWLSRRRHMSAAVARAVSRRGRVVDLNLLPRTIATGDRKSR